MSDVDETVNTNPLQQARQTYTGVSGEPQKVTFTTDTIQQIQQMANVITQAVVGANLTVDFAAGESEKYLVIDVDGNRKGGGTAVVGRDFSPVDMDVMFPMGIDKREIDIPIRSEYLVGDADFSLKLETVNSCEITDGTCGI